MCMSFFPTALGIVSDKGIREEIPPVLQYQVLQLALDLPASKFSWFRIQVKSLWYCGYFKAIFLGLFLIYCKFYFKCVECFLLFLRMLQIWSHQERSLYFTFF